MERVFRYQEKPHGLQEPKYFRKFILRRMNEDDYRRLQIPPLINPDLGDVMPWKGESCEERVFGSGASTLSYCVAME
jgi:hypothetical protein